MGSIPRAHEGVVEVQQHVQPQLALLSRVLGAVLAEREEGADLVEGGEQVPQQVGIVQVIGIVEVYIDHDLQLLKDTRISPDEGEEALHVVGPDVLPQGVVHVAARGIGEQHLELGVGDRVVCDEGEVDVIVGALRLPLGQVQQAHLEFECAVDRRPGFSQFSECEWTCNHPFHSGRLE